uniref:Uncharacterized protein n=1 Tax=Anguilla anguilla TaxID=7936 RepID=A0A0E9TFG3_ANGAN
MKSTNLGYFAVFPVFPASNAPSPHNVSPLVFFYIHQPIKHWIHTQNASLVAHWVVPLPLELSARLTNQGSNEE